jgi:hypothetical protein
MNKELKLRIFDIPYDVLNKINHTVVGLNGTHMRGIQRAKKLLADKKVKYGQLKRIIHDLQNIDKAIDLVKYDLAGGDLMLMWGKKFLDGERDIISNRKEGKKNADEIGGITGERKNSYLKKHKKKPDWLPPLNMIKPNSFKSTASALTSMKLFEEIEKFKKLINY